MHNPDRSIESFLIYKRQIEAERPQLTVEGGLLPLMESTEQERVRLLLGWLRH